MAKSTEDKFPVTMQSIARAAGVSPMTVSNAFRYPARVQEETRRKVLQMATQMGYVPNHAAGNLASGQSRIIGAVIPSIKNSSFYKYVRGMQDRASEDGYELILKLADNQSGESAAIQTFVGLRVAGIALVGAEHDEDALTLLRKAGTPVVESWVHGGAFDMAVGYSASKATRAMLDLLLRSGRTRVGFVGYQGSAAHRFAERLPAFRDMLAERGLRSDLLYLADETDGFGAGSKALDALQQQDPQIDAVLCPTDIIAAGVIFECNRRGWKVPDRIAVTGWGDYEISSEITPSLATLQPNTYQMGHQAVSMIIDRIRGKTSGSNVIDTGFEVLVRDSVGQA